MRRFVTVVWVTLAGVLAAGLTSAFAATGIAQEETVVLGEHTLKGRNLDLVGEANDFRPGDRYMSHAYSDPPISDAIRNLMPLQASMTDHWPDGITKCVPSR